MAAEIGAFIAPALPAHLIADMRRERVYRKKPWRAMLRAHQENEMEAYEIERQIEKMLDED
jgi:hypothetical protein